MSGKRAKSLSSDKPFRIALSNYPARLNVHAPTTSIDFAAGRSFGKTCAFRVVRSRRACEDRDGSATILLALDPRSELKLAANSLQ
jgi:hypothetical protein